LKLFSAGSLKIIFFLLFYDQALEKWGNDCIVIVSSIPVCPERKTSRKKRFSNVFSDLNGKNVPENTYFRQMNLF